MAFNRNGLNMKEQTKRFYDFTFEQLKEKLKLKGSFEAYNTKDSKGKDSHTLKIITIETKDNES